MQVCMGFGENATFDYLNILFGRRLLLKVIERDNRKAQNAECGGSIRLQKNLWRKEFTSR